MKNGLFLCCENYDFNDFTLLSVGIAKKIIAEVKAMNDNNLNCKLINLYYNFKNRFIYLFQIFFFRKIYINKITNIDFKSIDFIYIRRFIPLSRSFIFLLKYIKSRNHSCRIIYEIPTYPYDSEHKGVKGFIVLCIDKFFRSRLSNYIDYITTYSGDDIIFGIKTIRIVNGVDCSSILPINADYPSDSIHLIAVAQFCPWHGYDRLISGLSNYYMKNQRRKVYIDFVGSGPALPLYKNAVIKNKLESYVIFHGELSGYLLSRQFNTSDIAVCSLGCHRKSIFLSSELKSREYLARGLPMISSTKIDVLPSDYEYIQYVPEDDTPIDIYSVIDFYDKLKNKESRENQILNIRNFAEKYCDISVTMLPVIKILMAQ